MSSGTTRNSLAEARFRSFVIHQGSHFAYATRSIVIHQRSHFTYSTCCDEASSAPEKTARREKRNAERGRRVGAPQKVQPIRRKRRGHQVSPMQVSNAMEAHARRSLSAVH